MGWDYISLEEALATTGLRMTVVSNVPSPWGEAAKGIFHVKGLNWSAVRLDPSNPALVAWSGSASAPSVIYNGEPALTGWKDILLFAERLAPKPTLLPSDAAERELAFDWANMFCGPGGLGWERRLWLTHLGLKGTGGFLRPGAAQYLADKYGYSEKTGAAARGRVLDLLQRIAARLSEQCAKGSDYFFGRSVTVVDIYAATFAGIVQPLPKDVCDMREATRAAFADADDETLEVAGRLLAHRDMMYERWLEPVLRL